MGWFDNEKPKGRVDPPTRPAAPSADPGPSRKPAASAAPRSTLGERVHIDGTVVCREDLTVVGRLEGTIRSESTLRIANEARVEAVIHGRRVLIEGVVNGDIHGSEVVVLGPTARVTGNIQTPSLEVQSGAFLRGKVDMKTAREAREREAAEKRAAEERAQKEAAKRKAAAKEASERRAAAERSSESSGEADGGAEDGPVQGEPAGDERGDGSSGMDRQASSASRASESVQS